jgi:hypothetical protein
MNAAALRAVRDLLLDAARLTRYDRRRAGEASGSVRRARALHHEILRLARQGVRS